MYHEEFIKKHRREIEEVNTLLVRPLKVLVPNFPPFTYVDTGNPRGPLVDLLREFGGLFDATPEFESITVWDYERQITSGRADTIAAPIYVRSGQPLSIHCFCKVRTGYCVVNNSKVTFDFPRYLGRVHLAVRDINSLFIRYKERQDGKEFIQSYKQCIEQLRRRVEDLLKTSPRRSFAIPDEHDELQIINDYEFPPPQVIVCGADDDILSLTKEYADEGYVVLCNSVVRGKLLEEDTKKSYTSKPLLREGVPTWAGIPFSEKDKELGDLFGEFLRCGAAPVEQLLRQCESSGVELLSVDDRGIRRFNPTGSLAWSALLSQCDDYSNIILENLVKETGDRPRRRVLHGTVVRIDSLSEKAHAEVRLQDGETYQLRRIAVSRLSAADLAYSGAQFDYIVEDVGSNRLVTLQPDREANARKRDRLASLLSEFTSDEVHEEPNEAKAPHSDA